MFPPKFSYASINNILLSLFFYNSYAAVNPAIPPPIIILLYSSFNYFYILY